MTICIWSCSQSPKPADNVSTSKVTDAKDFTIMADIVYGHDYGMAMTYDVYVPSHPNGAGIILINSGR